MAAAPCGPEANLVNQRPGVLLDVIPRRENARVESTTIRFARAARELSRTARLCGVVAPSFISPPRRRDVSRTIRRRPNGTVVAVALRSRPWAAVLADMVDGVIVSNDLSGVEADTVRRALWLAVAEPENVAEPTAA